MASTKSSATLIELQTQIAALQQRAAEVRSKQYRNALSDIASLMKAFGITLDEVKKASSSGNSRKRATKSGKRRGRPSKVATKTTLTKKASRKVRKGKASRRPAAVKYKGPGGESWSGRGKQPVWLRTLLDQGKKLEDFKV